MSNDLHGRGPEAEVRHRAEAAAQRRRESHGHHARRPLLRRLGTLWRVRADGRATILADQRPMAAPLRLLVNRYWQYRQAPPTGPVLAVTVERWTGWTGAPATGAPTTVTPTTGTPTTGTLATPAD